MMPIRNIQSVHNSYCNLYSNVTSNVSFIGRSKHIGQYHINTEISLVPSLTRIWTHARAHTHPSKHTLYFITNNDNGNPNRISVAQALDNSFHFGRTCSERRAGEREGGTSARGRSRAQFVRMCIKCLCNMNPVAYIKQKLEFCGILDCCFMQTWANFETYENKVLTRHS